jgi:hypothetical protein
LVLDKSLVAAPFVQLFLQKRNFFLQLDLFLTLPLYLPLVSIHLFDLLSQLGLEFVDDLVVSAAVILTLLTHKRRLVFEAVAIIISPLTVDVSISVSLLGIVGPQIGDTTTLPIEDGSFFILINLLHIRYPMLMDLLVPSSQPIILLDSAHRMSVLH